MGSDGAALPGGVAVGACVAMSLLYVGILYSPRLLLRLPPPKTVDIFLIRRFVCAAIASLISMIASAILLRVWSFKAMPSIVSVYGIRPDSLGRAVFLPSLLTSLIYSGSLASKAVIYAQSSAETNLRRNPLEIGRSIQSRILNTCSNMLFWRNFLVAPVTEEIVFRACMIPLLRCAGFKNLSIIFFSPLFFSLAHLNHFLEFYFLRGYSAIRALSAVGLQLGYTTIFGAYAAFLFLRTGNLICPIVAHVFCNMMGLPAMTTRQDQTLTVMGLAAFVLLLSPLTDPDIYNRQREDCLCAWDKLS